MCFLISLFSLKSQTTHKQLLKKKKKKIILNILPAFFFFFSLKMKIIIRVCTGNDHTIDVEKSTTILSIKEQLYTLEGVPAKYQRILYEGQVIADTKTIESIGVEEGSVLHMVYWGPEG